MAYPSTKGTAKGEKAKSPKPGIPLNKQQILDLIPRCKGNLSMIADLLGTTRGCVRRHCQADATLTEALEDARERRIDELEAATLDDALDHQDATMRIFLLKTIGKHRGYEQSEAQNAAKDIATAAFDFIVNKSKNPAEQGK